MGKVHKDVLVVGLRGAAGAGKSRLASELAATLDRGFTMAVVSFAGPIKEGLKTMGICKGTTPEAYRRHAQEIGAGMRAQNPNHWTNLFQDKVRWWGDRTMQVIVADDLRYPNEAALCDLIFRIIPEGFNGADLGDRADHESETWNRLDTTTGVQIANVLGNSKNAVSAIRRYILGVLNA